MSINYHTTLGFNNFKTVLGNNKRFSSRDKITQNFVSSVIHDNVCISSGMDNAMSVLNFCIQYKLTGPLMM